VSCDTETPLIDPFGKAEPTYVQVADVIAVRIETGVYVDRLPSERQLAKEFGVAYMTLRYSMHWLRDRDLVVTRQGRGTFVADATRCSKLQAVGNSRGR
jgi:GntR family transcriptional regulator